MSCNCTNATSNSHTVGGSKGLIKINAFFLGITFRNKPTLMPINCSIRFSFSLYTHLVPIAFLPGGNSHQVHIPVFIIASYFDCIAATQLSEFCASSKETCSFSSQRLEAHIITIWCKSTRKSSVMHEVALVSLCLICDTTLLFPSYFSALVSKCRFCQSMS